MKTLIYHSGALGDFITTLPAISLWKKHTGSIIDLIGKTAYGEFAICEGFIDSVTDIDSRTVAALFCDSCEEYFAKINAEYDHAFLFASVDSELVNNFKKHFTGTLLSQPPFTNRLEHMADYHLTLVLEAIRLTEKNVNLSAEIYQRNLKSDRENVIAIHPGSASRLKNWPMDRFLSVAESLRNAGFGIQWIIGPVEESYSFPHCDQVIMNRSLHYLYKILQKCRLFIGNDSGVTHLAALTGCDMIALFGPSDPHLWAPRGNGHIEVINKRKQCAPCHHVNNGNGNRCSRECLLSISAEEISDIAMNIAANGKLPCSIKPQKGQICIV